MAFIRRCVPLLTQAFKIGPIATKGRDTHRWVSPTLMALKDKEKKAGGKKTNPRNTFLEWNLEAELYAFGKRLNEEFDSDLLLQSFTDRSYVIKEEMKQREMGIDISMKDNRELAVEGEKFMNEYLQLYLEAVLPKFPAEGLRAIKNYLMSEETLAHVSKHIGTKDIILASQYPVSNDILATTFKALVGVLIQSSEVKAGNFVRDFVITHLQGKDVNEYWQIDDPWAMLTDLITKDGSQIEPRLIGEVGRNTLLACYRVGLYIDKKIISDGFGETIAVAKEMAAREALKKMFGTEDHMKPINFKLENVSKSTSQVRLQISSS